MSKLRKNATKLKSNKSKANKAFQGSLRLDLGQDDNDDAKTKENTLNNAKTSNLLVGVPMTDDDTDADADTEDTPNNNNNKIKRKRKLKKKSNKISFVEDLLAEADDAEQKQQEKYSKYRNKKKVKTRRFIIIDPEYKGNRKIRKRKEHELEKKKKAKVKISLSPEDSASDIDAVGFDMFTRGETVYESDVDYGDIKTIRAENVKSIAINPQRPKHVKTGTGLRRKKKKLKKVKIRRLKRVRKKDKSLPQLKTPVSARTAKTIEKLKEQKEIDSNLLSLGINTKTTSTKNDKKEKKMSVKIANNGQKKEDPNKPPIDKFESMMTGFHTMACNKVEALDKQFENLKIFAGNVAVFFGEHDDLEWEELFKLFLTFFEQINKAKKQNADLEKKREKERKKKERERLKAERMKKRGLKPKKNDGNKSNEPVNILEEIKMKNAKGTLTPSKAKNDIVGYEKSDNNDNNDQKPKKKGKKKKKKKNAFGGGGGMSLLDQIKARGGQ